MPNPDTLGRLEHFVSCTGGWRVREERSIIASRRITDWIDHRARAVRESVERGSRRSACGGRWENSRRADPKIRGGWLDYQVD